MTISQDLMYQLCSTYIKYIARMHNLHGNVYSLKDGTRCFGFIPTSYIGDLVIALEKAYEQLYKEGVREPKFMDIGCGIGNVLLLAKLIGYHPTGLEYDLETYRVAKKICFHAKQGPIGIIRGDMKKFKHYSDFDVLYYYIPIASYDAMSEFSDKLSRQIKPGAYVICNASAKAYKSSKEFFHVDGCKWLWRKV